MTNEGNHTMATKNPKNAATKRTRKPAKGAKAKAKKAAAKTPRARRTPLAGKKITRLVRENPRRSGTHGHASFALIKSGMSVDKYLELGGRMNDLRWDIEHEYVKVA